MSNGSLGNVVLNLADGESEQSEGSISEEEGENEYHIKPFLS